MNDDVRRYFDELPAQRRAMVMALHEMVLALYPHAVVDLPYRMPCNRPRRPEC